MMGVVVYVARILHVHCSTFKQTGENTREARISRKRKTNATDETFITTSNLT